MDEAVLLRDELEAGIVRLTFNRPDKLNALSTPLVRSLENELDLIAGDPSVRVVILAGAGERAFVAGADIAEYRGNRSKEFIAYQLESRRVFDKLERDACLPACPRRGNIARSEIRAAPACFDRGERKVVGPGGLEALFYVLLEELPRVSDNDFRCRVSLVVGCKHHQRRVLSGHIDDELLAVLVCLPERFMERDQKDTHAFQLLNSCDRYQFVQLVRMVRPFSVRIKPVAQRFVSRLVDIAPMRDFFLQLANVVRAWLVGLGEVIVQPLGGVRGGRFLAAAQFLLREDFEVFSALKQATNVVGRAVGHHAENWTRCAPTGDGSERGSLNAEG